MMTAQQKLFSIFFLFITMGCENKLEWIKMPEATVPIVLSINPTSGSVGATVEVSGSNFSTNLSGNSVTINGTSAVVIDATSTTIVFIAPDETTGPVVIIVNEQQAINKPVFSYQ